MANAAVIVRGGIFQKSVERRYVEKPVRFDKVFYYRMQIGKGFSLVSVSFRNLFQIADAGFKRLVFELFLLFLRGQDAILRIRL